MSKRLASRARFMAGVGSHPEARYEGRQVTKLYQVTEAVGLSYGVPPTRGADGVERYYLPMPFTHIRLDPTCDRARYQQAKRELKRARRAP